MLLFSIYLFNRDKLLDKNKNNITSNVEFHNRYNIAIIPLIEQDQIIIITDV